MSQQRNKETIRRLVDAHNRQDAKAGAACFAAGATDHGRPIGPEGIKRVYENLYRTFPDFHWDLQVLIGEGEWVAARILVTGTHLGTPNLPVLGGLMHEAEPTGRKISILNIHMYRMAADGLIIEHSAARDDLGMMQQLGLLPATRHPAGDTSRPDT
jgi:predicted ester cyclase